MIVGLMGFAGAGKDSAAAHLTEHHGFVRVAFADPLKAVYYGLNPTVPLDLDAQETLGIDHWNLPLQFLVDTYGWDGAKGVKAVREGLQALWALVRDNLHPEAWIDGALRKADGVDRCVITDMRYTNEIEAIRSIGGHVVRVDRPGVGPANDHVSEHEWTSSVPDAVILNYRSLEELGDEVERVLEVLGLL